MFMKDIAGCILAGGKAIRMGGHPKAFIEIDGETIIDKISKVFKSIFEEILLVTNTPDLFAGYKTNYTIIPDIIKNIGPLGGIFTGLNKTSREAVFFVACDMPNLHNEVITNQIKFFEKTICQACVAKTGKFMEPLHAVYRKELVGKISSYVEKNTDYSLKAFLKTVKTAYFDTGSSGRQVFKNVNTPDDLI